MNQVFNLQGAEVNVFCSWGEGPDVGLNIVRSDDSLKTWPPKFLPIDMTAEEAIHWRGGLCNVQIEHLT